MRLRTLSFSICILFVGILFTALNADLVTFNYYLDSIKAPLSILVLIALIIGIILGVLITGLSLLRLKLETRGLRRELVALHEELDELIAKR